LTTPKRARCRPDVENAHQMQKAVVVAVADCRGELIAFARIDAPMVD
jgi:uncharacterized protein GlcG (DUF336 family)